MDVLPGQQLGNYRLLNMLGKGGFAEVFKGEHIYLKTQAALKLLHVQLTGEKRGNFLQEARTLAGLTHPHIIQVLDFGLQDDTPYLVMTYAPHGSVRQRYPEGTRLPLSLVAKYAGQVASALHYAHEQRIIHRDVKPENMLLRDQDDVMLSDFGLAIAAHSSYAPSEPDVVGTVYYMAPEQLQGRARFASDQYALAVVVYEWLTGVQPFRGSMVEIATQHMLAVPPPFASISPEVSPAVEQVVFKALAKDPQQRFASVREFADALGQVCSGERHAYTAKANADYATENINASAASGEERASSGEGSSATNKTLPPYWQVPYRRNPFFTGRTEVLRALREAYSSAVSPDVPAVQAISGLGGVGKTQIAVEYAYRHAADYQAVLLAGAETREELVADFLKMARLLALPEKDEQDQQRVAQAVKIWLERQSGWLLILDNADDIALVIDLLPTMGAGHILLTTRAQTVEVATRTVEIEQLTPEEGALCLLRRARMLTSTSSLEEADPDERAQALAIARALDGLPLALDQAGAYIEETACGLGTYLELYRTRSAKLLRLRGGVVSNHPQPVATTWSLTFEKIRLSQPAAAELLQCFAFLHPDAIPEELILEGASELGPTLQALAHDPVELNFAIKALRGYSLVRRSAQKKTLSIHRLVQVVLISDMDEAVQKMWAERVTRAVERVLPEAAFETSERCLRYLPHAQRCAQFIAGWNLASSAAADLLRKTGLYLQYSAQYPAAEHFLRLALEMQVRVLGPEHADVAESLSTLGHVYWWQGKYRESAQLVQQALAMRERLFGSEHRQVANSINQFALLTTMLGQYEEGERLFRRALDLYRALSEPPLRIASSLNNLGTLLYTRGKYAEAKELHREALAIYDSTLGLDHPRVAGALVSMGTCCRLQGKYEEAALFLAKAVVVCEKTMDAAHPLLADAHSHQAELLLDLGRYEEAESIFRRSLSVYEQTAGADQSEIALHLNLVGMACFSQGKHEEAREIFARALSLHADMLGHDHPKSAFIMNNLGGAYTALGDYTHAETLLREALAVQRRMLGRHHPETVLCLNNLGRLFYARRNYTEAGQIITQALAGARETLGAMHPHIAASLNILSAVYYATRAYEQSAQLLEESLGICETLLPADHPLTAHVRRNLLLVRQKRDAR